MNPAAGAVGGDGLRHRKAVVVLIPLVVGRLRLLIA